MAEDKKEIMSEPYKEFDNSQWPNIDIKIKNYTVKVREVLLAVIAAVSVVTVIALSIALGLTHGGSTSPTVGPAGTCVTQGCLEASSYVLLNLNSSVNPCDDFYTYACGQFKNWTFIRADDSDTTIFMKLGDANRERLKAVIEKPVVRQTEHAWERKIKEMFKACTNQYGRDIAGANPFLTQLVPKAGGWWMVTPGWNPANWDMTEAMKTVHVDYWTNALFTFYVTSDPIDPTKNIVEIDYSGLGMYWIYYTRDDAPSQMIRDAYKKFINTTAQLFMQDPSITLSAAEKTSKINTFVNDVFDFETKLANVTLYTVPTDSPHHPDMRKTMQELNGMADVIDWTRFWPYMFKDGGMTASTKLVLLEHDYLSKVSALVSSLGTNQRRIMNNYMMWRMAQTYAQDLSWQFVHANREFYVARTGRQAFLGNWKYCFNYAGRKMGTALSALFVRDHFDKDDKAGAHTLVKYLKMSLQDLLKNAKWMDDKTRAIGTEKIDAIQDKLGYPDILKPENDAKIDDKYSDLKVNGSDFFQNVISMNAFERKDWNRRLLGRADDNTWWYNAHDTAMYYFNPWNELLVPAGMLQFPLYDKKLPMFMNFGSIGAIMSHELMHSVDELGGYYKKDGTFFDWWTNATTQNYRKSRKCIIDYYTNKTAGPYRINNTPIKVPINARGYATEAIAETYGLKQAYLAYKKWVTDSGVEPVAPGLNMTNEQAFFVSFGQTYCFNRKDLYSYQLVLRNRVPENMAVNGAVSQLDEFQKAFNCPATAKMNTQNKCNMF